MYQNVQGLIPKPDAIIYKTELIAQLILTVCLKGSDPTVIVSENAQGLIQKMDMILYGLWFNPVGF